MTGHAQAEPDASAANPVAVKPLSSGAEFKLGDELLRVEFVTDRIAPGFARRGTWRSRKRRASHARSTGRETGKVEVTDRAGSPFVELRSAKLIRPCGPGNGIIAFGALRDGSRCSLWWKPLIAAWQSNHCGFEFRFANRKATLTGFEPVSPP